MDSAPLYFNANTCHFSTSLLFSAPLRLDPRQWKRSPTSNISLPAMRVNNDKSLLFEKAMFVNFLFFFIRNQMQPSNAANECQKKRVHQYTHIMNRPADSVY